MENAKMDNKAMTSYRELWNNYRSELLFFVLLLAITVLSYRLSRFIPDDYFDNLVTPMLSMCTFVVAFTGSWLIFRHSEGMRMRRLWGYVLLAWGLGDLAYLVCYLIAPLQLMNMGADRLTTHELMIGNLLGWVMVLYPTEVLRPGWLTLKTVTWQLLPMVSLVMLDYVLPVNLWPVVALYPYALLVLTLTHIRAYRLWCEQNYSSMDNIDVQWVIRYCIMLFFIGANYIYICTSHDHTRCFTQEWFVMFMLVYSTEQILFRKDPWTETSDSANEDRPAADDDADSQRLEQWFETEMPYRNPDFKLMDLRAVLPKNRTYLSQFINDHYNCSFYQFVNKYRIGDAKELLRANPKMKMDELASQCGFSSRESFSRAFTQETGMSPREWAKCNNS